MVKYSPQLEDAFPRRKRPVWTSGRMDETYIKVKGQWRSLYRAVDKHGQTIDFLLTEQRDTEAALRCLKKAMRRNGLPETITIEGSDANEAAIKRYNQEHDTEYYHPSGEILQQHRGTRSSGREAGDTAHVGVQSV